jgi:hypothetical protein
MIPEKQATTYNQGGLTMSRVSSASASTSTTQQQQPSTMARVPHDKVAMRAYEKWCQRGRPQGTHMQDWLEAERELQAEATRQQQGQRR